MGRESRQAVLYCPPLLWSRHRRMSLAEISVADNASAGGDSWRPGGNERRGRKNETVAPGKLGGRSAVPTIGATLFGVHGPVTQKRIRGDEPLFLMIQAGSEL